jgi:hypothetical protein
VIVIATNSGVTSISVAPFSPMKRTNGPETLIALMRQEPSCHFYTVKTRARSTQRRNGRDRFGDRLEPCA